MGKQLRGMTMLSLAAFIWGTAFVAQRMGMDHVGPATFMAVRFLVGGASLVPVIIINSIISGRLGRKPESGDAPSRLLWRAGVYCGIVIFVCGILQQVGILYTTVGKSGFITTLYIVIVPILGLFLGRGVSPSVWGCICIAAVGMYMLCVKESASINRGDVYTLFCALFYSVHILLVDHYSPKVDAVKLSSIQFFVCSGLAFVAAFMFERPEIAAISSAWASILYTGVLSSGVAFTLQIFGQRDVSPVAASLIMSLESVFAVMMGWMLLHELLSAKELFGCALIFAANLLVQISGAIKKTG